MLKRIQFIELQDLAWLPSTIRDGVTSYLEFLLRVFKIYDPVSDVINDILLNHNIKTVVDLCSGAGGPTRNIAQYFPEHKFLLTDLYPNFKAFKKVKKTSSNIDFVNDSVNALQYRYKPNQMLTMYTSFHHFNNYYAKRIIENAVAHKCSICINEFVQRDLKSLLMVIPSPFFLLFLMPFVTPFSLSRLFFTYLVPLIPFVTLWDIVVTVLRIRKKEELMEMTKEFTNYEWTYTERKTNLFLKVSSFVGVPKNA